MASNASPTPAETLATYVAKGKGCFTLGPVEALMRLVPDLGQECYKGQLGRVGVFGGSKDYTGAPFFASMSSLRTGADLAYVMTAEEAAPALKAYSPELMVTPVYSAGWPRGFVEGREDLHEAVEALLPKLHSLVMGPGMGREQRLQVGITEVVRSAMRRGLPIVLDADALVVVACGSDARLTHEDLKGGDLSELDGLLRDYPKLVLTPNAHEFRLLHRRIKANDPPAEGDRDATDADEFGDEQAVETVARSLGGVTVVRKGRIDMISDGTRTISCAVPGGLKRCGGIGDVLSGAMGTFMAWASIQGFQEPEAGELRLWAAWWACAVTKHASRLAYEAHGRSMSATHVLENVGRVLEQVAPSPPVDTTPIDGFRV